MKKEVINLLKKYLKEFPNELDRLQTFIDYLKRNNNEQVCDWNNFDGHIVASGFIYAIEEQKFLVMFHKDLKMFLYPGGHTTIDDKTPLETAKREIEEETGLHDLKQLSFMKDLNVPFDIDTQHLGRNERLNLPEHYHFDFRYFFAIDKITDIQMDTEELAEYKWVTMDELYQRPNYKKLSPKIEKILSTIELDKDISD